MATDTTKAHRGAGFRHDALLVAGPEDFTARVASFVRDSLEAEEPILVVVTPQKIAMLRDALGTDARGVLFGDMAEIGLNPSRIIPVWHDHMARVGPGGGRVRGIGEPIWAGRPPEELVEAQRHETLINLAFDGAPAWILCPYDTTTLEPDVIDEAYRSHPFVVHNDLAFRSPTYPGLEGIPAAFRDPLPEPDAPVETIAIEASQLNAMRSLVLARASAFGLPDERVADLVLAVNEVASNSVRHGGGGGVLRMWQDGDELLCEVRDAGRIADPLVGRARPNVRIEGGLGLWLVNQLCDLVQVRMPADGSVVRMHMRR